MISDTGVARQVQRQTKSSLILGRRSPRNEEAGLHLTDSPAVFAVFNYMVETTLTSSSVNHSQNHVVANPPSSPQGRFGFVGQ